MGIPDVEQLQSVCDGSDAGAATWAMEMRMRAGLPVGETASARLHRHAVPCVSNVAAVARIPNYS